MIARRALLAAPLAALARPAAAQGAFPTRPLRLIVPYAAVGTAPDLHARLFADAIGPRLGQRVVVENRPGAGGMIGARLAARAPADGYHLLWAAGSLFGTNPYLFRNPGYGIEEFVGVGGFSFAAFVLFGRATLGPRGLPELLALMRARPEAVRYANGGIGSQLHLTWEMLKRRAGVTSLDVPFPAGGTVTAILAENADVSVAVLDQGLLQFFADGRLVPYAMTSATRARQLPQVPTVAESGFPGFEAAGGYAAFAPREVPPEPLARLRAAAAEVVADPAMVARLEQLVAVPHPVRDGGQLVEWTLRDSLIWRAIISELGLALD